MAHRFNLAVEVSPELKSEASQRTHLMPPQQLLMWLRLLSSLLKKSLSETVDVLI
jgi:hypothetical protein